MAPKINAKAAGPLQKTLDELSRNIPGVHLSVASPTSILFSGQAGLFDMLDQGPSSRKASSDDIMWFASTTKLLTAVCYLRLVDQGVLTLETDMREFYAPLREATSKILEGFDEDGKPIFAATDRKVTLGMMLNQTSGFGQEFGEKVQRWKKVTDKGKGYVNSCKVVRGSVQFQAVLTFS
jgi:CubicO group peptidase (beta-lactamase class C family)